MVPCGIIKSKSDLQYMQFYVVKGEGTPTLVCQKALTLFVAENQLLGLGS